MGVFILGNSKVLGVRYAKFFETYIRNVFLNNLNLICFHPFLQLLNNNIKLIIVIRKFSMRYSNRNIIEK